MKKSLLAAAVTGTLACAASAQSTVTLAGIVDAWMGQTTTRTGTAPAISNAVIESGGGQASRWKLLGSEDLGGGLRATFLLDQGIAIDSGTVSTVSASNIGFNRGAYLGLSGGFGEIRGGRMLSAYDALRGSTNHLYDSSGFASTGTVWGASTTAANGLAAVAGSDYLARGNNTLMYITPKVGAFSGSMSFSADEDQSTASSSPRTIAGHVKYEAGPARIGYSYQSERYTTGNNKFHLIAGNYNFGSFKMVGAIQRQIDTRITGDQKANEWELGLDMPIGLATLAFGYASSVAKNPAGATVLDAHGLSLMGTYDLSKRTRLYTAYRKINVDRADGSSASEASRWGMGVTHTF
ncbi:MAG: porin [Rhodoferax sp.]